MAKTRSGRTWPRSAREPSASYQFSGNPVCAAIILLYNAFVAIRLLFFYVLVGNGRTHSHTEDIIVLRSGQFFRSELRSTIAISGFPRPTVRYSPGAKSVQSFRSAVEKKMVMAVVGVGPEESRRLMMWLNIFNYIIAIKVVCFIILVIQVEINDTGNNQF